MKIYCDGACKGNPGLSGSGVVVFHNDNISSYSGEYEENGTNNTAELKAFKKALELSQNDSHCTIYVDSQYTINSITKWAYNWKKNNWTKKGGIKNLELIKEIHSLYDSFKESLDIVYVKGHSGDYGNDLADKAANIAIQNKYFEWTLN
jgi:ribonuclease HI